MSSSKKYDPKTKLLMVFLFCVVTRVNESKYDVFDSIVVRSDYE